jgi:hypothetical protein
LLNEVYGEDALLMIYVSEWHKVFLEGREETNDDKQPSRPVTVKTDKWKK